MAVSLFLFCRYDHLCCILDYTYKWHHIVFVIFFLTYFAPLVALMVKNLPAMQATEIWSLGSGRSPGEDNEYPVYSSCLRNPVNWRAWQAIVHRVTKSQTWLTNTFPLFWLTLLSIIISRSIHVTTNGITSLFLWLSSIPLYICTISLSIHLLMGISVISISWLL